MATPSSSTRKSDVGLATFDLHKFQIEHAEWVEHNFPGQAIRDNRHHSFLGVVEEVGELAHAMLKYEQGIRDGRVTNEEVRAQLADGVGDLMVFLAGCCDVWQLDLEECIRATWEQVRQRDWIKFPHDGRTS